MKIEDLSENDTMLDELYNIREEEIGRNIKELKNKARVDYFLLL